MKSNSLNKHDSKTIVKSNKVVFRTLKKKLEDELMPQVKDYIKDMDYISTFDLQKKFHIGFPRAYMILKDLIDGLYVREETEYKVDKDSLKYEEEARKYFEDLNKKL
jgi:ribosomal protein S25